MREVEAFGLVGGGIFGGALPGVFPRPLALLFLGLSAYCFLMAWAGALSIDLPKAEVEDRP